MPSLSRNQWLFALIAAVLTAGFFVLLHGRIADRRWSDIPLVAIGYGLAMFLAGLGLGATDPVAKSRSDLGFGYHAITFVVVATLGVAACIHYAQPLWPHLIGLAGWFAGLVVHYVFSRRTIKGMEAEEAFP